MPLVLRLIREAKLWIRRVLRAFEQISNQLKPALPKPIMGIAKFYELIVNIASITRR